MPAYLPDTVRSLEDLRDVLAAAALDDENDGTEAKYARRFGLPLDCDGLIDLWNLPKFGGDNSYTFHAWSWDAERILVGDDILDLEIVSRCAVHGQGATAPC